MKIDLIVSSIVPGGGITTFVIQLCKLLGYVHSLRLIVTHKGVGKEQVDYLKPFLRRGLTDMSKSYKLWRYIRLIYLWRNDIPDYIINNYNAVGQYVLPILSKRVRNIHIVHGITSDFNRVATINKTYTVHWVVPSKKTATILVDAKKSVEKRYITIIPHGVEDIPEFNKCRNRKEGKIRLIYTGVLEEHKGADILLEVVRNLERKDILYRFDIVGEGSLRERLKESLAAEIITGKVYLHGNIDHERVLWMFSQCDILVYPTRVDSFGFVIAEAMMGGCVPIVGKIEGVTDQIIDNTHDGFLVSADAEEIVEKIYALSQDNQRLKSMSECARHSAETRYSLTVMTEAYNKLFTRLS